MGAGEQADWARYYASEPFGFPREEARHAILASNILAASRNRWKSNNLLKASAWMYKPFVKISDDESLEIMRSQVPQFMKLLRVRAHGFKDS
jgi:hypothetical protein